MACLVPWNTVLVLGLAAKHCSRPGFTSGFLLVLAWQCVVFVVVFGFVDP